MKYFKLKIRQWSRKIVIQWEFNYSKLEVFGEDFRFESSNWWVFRPDARPSTDFVLWGFWKKEVHFPIEEQNDSVDEYWKSEMQKEFGFNNFEEMAESLTEAFLQFGNYLDIEFSKMEEEDYELPF